MSLVAIGPIVMDRIMGNVSLEIGPERMRKLNQNRDDEIWEHRTWPCPPWCRRTGQQHPHRGRRTHKFEERLTREGNHHFEIENSENNTRLPLNDASGLGQGMLTWKMTCSVMSLVTRITAS